MLFILHPYKSISMKRKSLFSFFVLPFTLLLFYFLMPLISGAQAYVKKSRFYAGSVTTIRKLIADNMGNSYMLAATTNNSFPVTIAYSATGAGTKGVLIKYDANGNEVWSRYLPHSSSGAGNTIFHKIVLDNGILYLIGASTSTNVPVTNGSVAGGGISDIIYTRVDATNGAVLTTAYLGGNGSDDIGTDIAVENGNIYATYTTTSSNVPVTTGPAYTSGYDHVMLKMDAQANIAYCTYTGSVSATLTEADSVSLAVNNGSAALGMSVSSANNFVTTNGSTVKGDYDFGIIKLDATGNKTLALVFGGTNDEIKPTLVMNNAGLFISGYSLSGNYPVTDNSSFTGTDRRHVITKFDNTGSVVFSSNQAGVTAGADLPLMQVKNGSVYLVGSNHNAIPAVNVTDGSTGGSYLVRLSAVNGQVLFAVRFSGQRNFANASGTDFTISDDGKIFAAVPVLNASPIPATTDGSVRVSTGGNHIVGFTTDGKLFFSTLKATGSLAGNTFVSLATSPGKLFVALSPSQASALHIPVSDPPASDPPGTGSRATWMMFELCPPMPTDNIVTPLSQTICAEGFTQSITGDKVAFSSANMPVLMTRTGATYPQMEIPARYQWQTAASAAGPWSDIPGLGTQKDYTPPSVGANRYYRRLVLPPFGCGDAPVSISDVAEVLVNSNVAPVITSDIYTTCAGTPVNILANVTGGATPYSYVWDNGIASTTNAATVTPSANSVYTVIVTDNNGCQQAGQVIVNAYAADAGPATVSSCAGNPVRIGTTPPAGVPGVTYSWSPATGLDDPNIAQPLATPSASTVYTLSMTVPVSGGGTCTTTDNITVNVVAAPATLNFAGDDKAVCIGGTLSLGTTAEAGFTYTWAPGNYLNAVNASTATFNAGSEQPSPNTFTYYLTAARNGCTFTDRVNVSVLEVDAGDDLCGPRTVGTEDKIPGVTGKVYLWEKISGPGSITGATNTAVTTVSASVGGSTTYRLTVSYLGVSCSDEVIVPECSAGIGCPDLEIDVVAEHGCPSTAFGSVTLNALPSNLSPARWTYSWSASPAGGISSATGTSITLTDNVERDITLTVTSVDNPSFTCSETIHVNGPSWARPTFTAVDAVVCPGTTLSIGQTPVVGYSYSWSNIQAPDNIISNPSVTPISTTEYIAEVTDDLSGCITRDTATITIKSIIVDPGPDWVTCSNVLVQLGSPALPGYTYAWIPVVAAYQNGTDHLSAQPQVLIAATQDFTLTVTDTETGCTLDSTVRITVDNGTTLTGLRDTAICRGTSAVIGARALPGVTYSWSPAAGLSAANVAQPTANPTVTTIYTVTATFYDLAGNPACSKTGTVTVTVNAPDITMSNDNICPSGALYNLSTGVTVSPDATTFSWSPASLVTSPTSFSTTVRANPVVPTTYTLTARDANGCAATASKIITPTITAPVAGSNGMVCVGSNITLGDIANDDDGSTISWSVTPALAGTLTTATSPAPVFTPAAGDANKTFVFTISKTNGGCTSTSTVSINVRQFVLPAMPVQTVCTNSSITIGVPAVAGVTYVWTPSTGLTNPNASSTVATNITGTTVYTLTATDINGCFAASDAIVGVNATPAPTVSIPDVTVSVGATPAAFNPSITPAGSYTYSWTPADKVDNPYIANATAVPGSIGNTTYTLTVTDANGCTSVAQTQLKVVAVITLPITLSSFIINNDDKCDVRLNWTVSEAYNFSHFVIERSANGISYQPINVINYNDQRAAYAYTDINPGSNKWFYRLKLVDIDGKFSYSRIVSSRVICGSEQQARLNIYPNPAQSSVNINSNKAISKIQVYTAQGQLVSQRVIGQTQPATCLLQLDNKMSKGLYFIQVICIDGTIQHSKLIKQ